MLLLALFYEDDLLNRCFREFVRRRMPPGGRVQLAIIVHVETDFKTKQDLASNDIVNSWNKSIFQSYLLEYKYRSFNF